MLREARMKNSPEVIDGFRMRGREVTRLESFSDAVFGFALTLLVVSLDAPKTFADLVGAMRGFPAFAVCFLFLAIIWNSHYNFCRRYGLDDGTSRFLTCFMLFLVLFYVYPLKFLFNLSINGMIFGRTTNAIPLTGSQFSVLLVIYGLGFAAVYLALALLYVHAYRLREPLELTELERLDTRHKIYRLLILVGVGLTAALFARIPWALQWSGLIYVVLFPLMRLQRIIHLRRRAPLAAANATG